MRSDPLPPLIVILGPTAVGKTETAVRLAGRLGGEIISADSRQFYRGMDLGTAKPTPAERSRIPHHLVDVIAPDEPWSLAQFQQAAFQAIDAMHPRGRLPFLVGGTGQFVRAIAEGWDIPPQQPNPRLRAVLAAWAGEIGSEAFHQRLAVLDPPAAALIDYRNVRRTIRAFEVIFHTGKRFSAQRRRHAPRYRLLQIGLMRPRADLYARIDARIDAMLAAGLLEEVRGLLARYPGDLPAFSAIGYRELVRHLEGACTLDEAVAAIRRNTRQFVRRQANWFKQDDPDIHWFMAEADPLAGIEQLVRGFLEVAARG